MATKIGAARSNEQRQMQAEMPHLRGTDIVSFGSGRVEKRIEFTPINPSVVLVDSVGKYADQGLPRELLRG